MKLSPLPFCMILCLCSFASGAQQAPADAAAPAPAAVAAPSSSPQADAPSLSPSGAATPSPAMSKASLKDQQKRDKAEARKQKEAEKEASYLKLEGDTIVAPTLDADGNPIKLPSCSSKDKECIKKRKALLHQKKQGMKIENGTLTVDGWTGKARLNYDISEVKFLYISAPGIGTVIASLEHFPNSAEQKQALQGNLLTLTTPDSHTVQIASDHELVDKKQHSMFVAVDTGYLQPGRYPSVGYGSTARAPYNWPGVRPPTEKEKKSIAGAPPLPKGMETAQMNLPCQNVSPGEQVKPVKINGITMTPAACPSRTPTTGAFAAGTRPPDGSGAASTGIAEVQAKE